MNDANQKAPITKDDIASVIGSLIGAFELENEQAARANPAYAQICGLLAGHDPEDFYLCGPVRAIENLLKTAVKDQLGITDSCAADIWVAWGFFESHLVNICRNLYGSPCCADRARSILAAYLHYAKTGKETAFDPSKFYHPRTGTFAQWMALVKGVYALRHGQYMPFGEAWMAILEVHHKAKEA